MEGALAEYREREVKFFAIIDEKEAEIAKLREALGKFEDITTQALSKATGDAERFKAQALEILSLKEKCKQYELRDHEFKKLDEKVKETLGQWSGVVKQRDERIKELTGMNIKLLEEQKKVGSDLVAALAKIRTQDEKQERLSNLCRVLQGERAALSMEVERFRAGVTSGSADGDCEVVGSEPEEPVPAAEIMESN
jgi:chromosome segregation ATPase